MKFIRPPQILCFPADLQGPGHWRVIWPLAALMMGGRVDGRFDVTPWPIEGMVACGPDVVVWQRPLERGHLDIMAEARKALPKAFFVYEVDDLLDQMSAKNRFSHSVGGNVAERVREGLGLCDAATVTTQKLADWLHGFGMADVRVIPNLVPAANILTERKSEVARKIRVGWAGSESHTGSLELIEPAIREVGDKVEWVFMGLRPANVGGVPIEYHDPVDAAQYTRKLHELDIDVFLAPLEDIPFNEAKSNIRLLDAGVCRAAVIAQDISSYRLESPPVLAWCKTAEDWTREIKGLLKRSPSKRRKAGADMAEWVKKHFSYDNRIDDRLRAWLPADAEPFKPRFVKSSGEVVRTSEPRDFLALCAAPQVSDSPKHVMWVRPGTRIPTDMDKRLHVAMIDGQYAAAMPVATDGLSAFPATDRFIPVDDKTAADIAAAANAVAMGYRMDVPMAWGPCVLLRAEALALLGVPDLEAYGDNMDAALTDWTGRAAMRGMPAIQIADSYAAAGQPPLPLSPDNVSRMRFRDVLRAMQRPTETLPPWLRMDIELAFFKRVWTGLRPGMAGFADDWATHSAMRRDPPANTPGSVPYSGSNYGKRLDTDPGWVYFQSEGSVSVAAGRAAALRAIAGNPDAMAVYTDHELVLHDGRRIPFLKPPFDLTWLQGNDWITPCVYVRRDILPGVVESPAHLLSILLNAAAEHEGDPRKTFIHVPEIGAVIKEQKPTEETDKDRVAEAVEKARVLSATAVSLLTRAHPYMASMGYVDAYHEDKDSSVQIVVRSSGDKWTTDPAIKTIMARTNRMHYDITVAQSSAEAIQIGKDSTADFICFIDEGVRVEEPNWLSVMVGRFQDRRVALVGARVQVAQIKQVASVGLASVNGLGGRVHGSLASSSPGSHGYAALSHEALSVGGECFAVKKESLSLLGGFDDAAMLRFGRKLYDAGKVAVVEANAVVYSNRHPPKPFNCDIEDPCWPPTYTAVATREGVTGFDFDRLKYAEKPPTGERVLVINDRPEIKDNRLHGLSLSLHQAGHVVHMAEATDFLVHLTAPTPSGQVTWDVRDRTALHKGIVSLGISRVFLVSLTSRVGVASLELLRCLNALAVPVDYVGRDHEAVCPRRDMKVNGELCGDGWKESAARCQACIDKHGSPFGRVSVGEWWLAWAPLMAVQDRMAAD